MSKRPAQLCAVRIGVDTYILPMADGLKLIDIMSTAIPAEPVYGHDKIRWALNPRDELHRAELSLVRRDELEEHQAHRAKPLALPAPTDGGAP
jgi:hypothetical protein